jgi:hypothetical protein
MMMKRVVIIGALTLAVAGVAVAQQPTAPSTPAPGHQHSMQDGMCPMMSGGMMGGGMMQGGMMPGMMGMMGRGESDPRMMQMRGEMMKAIGDIMIKYGKMMEGSAR